MIRTSIRRPVAIAMTYLTISGLGVFAWRNIPVEFLPTTELPRLTVSASWGGASPETVEAFLTSPLEATVQQVRGVERVTSTSEESRSRVEVEFARDTDMNFARLELSELITILKDDLPHGVEAVNVTPWVPESLRNRNTDLLLLSYTYTGPYSLEALRLHLDDVVVPGLNELEGVGIVRVYGGRERLIRLEMDPDLSSSLGITPGHVQAAINRLDLVQEAGTVRGEGEEWAITIRNRATSIQDISEAVVARRNGRLIRVQDVAKARDAFAEARSHYRINRNPAINLQIYREPGSNAVEVATQVKAAMIPLQARSPAGSYFTAERDQSRNIGEQLTNLRSRALISAFVILAVLLLFLRSFRSAVVVFATIAFSILISLNLIYFGGMTLNIYTLMGLTMGFGLIVDNSIVVLENIYRRWQTGEDSIRAAEEGSRRVVLPVLAATFTTLVVLIPFVYLQNELRIYYLPLAFVVGLTLLASLFVAFSFIPALTSRVLGSRRGKKATPGGMVDLERLRGGADASAAAARAPIYVRFYAGMLAFTLRHPWAMIWVVILCFAGSYHAFDEYVYKGYRWGGGGYGQRDDHINISIRLPRGAEMTELDRLTRFFEDRLAAMPEPDRVITNASAGWGSSPPTASIQVYFPDSLDVPVTNIPVAIKEQMVAYSLEFTGVDVRVYGYTQSFYGGGGGGAPNFSMRIRGYNYEEVREIAEDLGRRLRRIPRVRDVNTNSAGSWYEENSTEYNVEIDRPKLARYDLSVADVVPTIRSAIAGEGRDPSSVVKIGGDEVQYQIKVQGYDTTDVFALREMIIRAPNGKAIRLGDIVTIRAKDVLAKILREDQQYVRTVAYEFRGPHKLGSHFHDQTIKATALPPGYTITSRGDWVWTAEARQQIRFVLGLAVLLVFMVTAAVFESFKQPFYVLLTLPLAMIGVFLIFFYSNATFTREAWVGVIMMAGIVVNNAILLVDHINRVRTERGIAFKDAVIKGTLERVRPILMTTTTTVFGLLPLVLFSQYADENVWNALGFALIGGLLSSTFFVLTVIPALYFLFEKGRTGPQDPPPVPVRRAVPTPAAGD